MNILILHLILIQFGIWHMMISCLLIVSFILNIKIQLLINYDSNNSLFGGEKQITIIILWNLKKYYTLADMNHILCLQHIYRKNICLGLYVCVHVCMSVSVLRCWHCKKKNSVTFKFMFLTWSLIQNQTRFC